MINKISKLLALAALVAIFTMSVLYLSGVIGPGSLKSWLLILTLIWFAAAAYWMVNRKEAGPDD